MNDWKVGSSTIRRDIAPYVPSLIKTNYHKSRRPTHAGLFANAKYSREIRPSSTTTTTSSSSSSKPPLQMKGNVQKIIRELLSDEKEDVNSGKDSLAGIRQNYYSVFPNLPQVDPYRGPGGYHEEEHTQESRNPQLKRKLDNSPLQEKKMGVPFPQGYDEGYMPNVHLAKQETVDKIAAGTFKKISYAEVHRSLQQDSNLQRARFQGGAESNRIPTKCDYSTVVKSVNSCEAFRHTFLSDDQKLSYRTVTFSLLAKKIQGSKIFDSKTAPTLKLSTAERTPEPAKAEKVMETFLDYSDAIKTTGYLDVSTDEDLCDEDLFDDRRKSSQSCRLDELYNRFETNSANIYYTRKEGKESSVDILEGMKTPEQHRENELLNVCFGSDEFSNDNFYQRALVPQSPPVEAHYNEKFCYKNFVPNVQSPNTQMYGFKEFWNHEDYGGSKRGEIHPRRTQRNFEFHSPPKHKINYKREKYMSRKKDERRYGDFDFDFTESRDPPNSLILSSEPPMRFSGETF